MSDNSGTTTRLNEIPKWDGKASSAPMYMTQVKAFLECQELDDVLDESKMTNLPTKRQYDALDPTDSTHDAVRKVYQMNKKVVTIFTLGQKSANGLATIDKTKVNGHDAGVAWKVMKMWEKKYRPGDATAELELDNELEKIKFGGANDYYESVTTVMTKFAVVKTDTDLIKLLMKSQNNTTFTMMAMDELKKDEDDRSFEDLCEKINCIQRMQKTGNSHASRREKEVQLTSQVDKDAQVRCQLCNKIGHKKANCPSKKKCNCCGKTGHSESECWEKHPEQAPKWIQDKMSKRKEAGGASVDKEIQMCNLCFDGQDFA